MVVVSYSGREINAKIVYYGPGLSGKTTNLEKIYDSVPETNRGRMVSMKTQTDRTLFFDLLPLDLGDLQGMKTRLLLYTVPGQVYYNATRKLVLKGVDAVVFVADSAPDKMAENRESLSNLEMNLKAYGMEIRNIPWVLQLNKRDLPNAVPVADMVKDLNRHNVPVFEAQAANGTGVFETLRGVSKLLLAKITKDVLEKERGSLARAQKEKPAAGPAASAGPVSRERTEEPEPTAPGGKLLKFLKRGRDAIAPQPPEPEVAPPPAEPAPLQGYDRNPFLAQEAPGAMEAPAEPPMLSEDLLEGEPARMDETGSDDHRPQNAEEELTLDEQDFVHQDGSTDVPAGRPLRGRTESTDGSEPAPTPARRVDRDAPAVVAAEARRVDADIPVVIGAGGEARRVTVPIDLGQLPTTGRVTLTFEVRIQVESPEEARRHPRQTGSIDSGIDESFTQDLELLR